jgi:hypothetical protein
VNYQVGYIQFGKDRQHPVSDPNADVRAAALPVLWGGRASVMTWYDSVGATYAYMPLWELTPPEIP